jgi:hypothetical protein
MRIEEFARRNSALRPRSIVNTAKQPWKWLGVFTMALATFFGSRHELSAAKIDPATFAIYNYSGGAASNLTGAKVSPPFNLHVVSPNETNAGAASNQVAPAAVTASFMVTNLTDNNLQTFITLSNPAVLVIDLGQTSVIDRVYLIGTTNRFGLWPNSTSSATNPPLGLIVAYVGNTAANTNQVAEFTVPYDAGNPVDTEVDMRFSPATGRYIRLELQTQVAWGVKHWPGYALTTQPPATNVSWNVGEIELYGFTGASASQTNLNAVVLPTGAPAPLALAASDLSYYLGELTGSPHPIIPPASTNQFTGTLYTIVDLKALAPNYATMIANIAAGLLPNNVNVTAQGRQVLFRAWPYRCVLWSVWEFLERQGVRWLYPDAHGDFVPAGKGVNLSMLPLQFTPSATSIYANWATASLQPWPPWIKQSLRQGYLYPWRNRWNNSWSTDVIGGAEIPAMAPTGIPLSTNYTEQFAGYPHNLNNVVPARILLQNSNWWGYDTNVGARISPTNSAAPAFCMDNPDLIQWVANKMIAVNQSYPLATTEPLNLAHFRNSINLLPMDSATLCQCPEWCSPANGPFEPNTLPYGKLYIQSESGMYFNFVTAVANLLQQAGSSAIVGSLAYADTFAPPTNIPALSTFPTNVQVEVCLWGAPNLPMSSPCNMALKQAFDTWDSMCSRLATYDYALLHDDYCQTNPAMPVPLVSATVDRANYLASIGALNGGCQATPESLPYNPWNFYAYPRIRWSTNQTAAQLEQEFFAGFYGEAAAPMLTYYQTMENYHVTNNVDLHPSYFPAAFDYALTPGSFPLDVLAAMKTNLTTAERLATNWWVANRVAHAREGYNWVVSTSGLTGTNLSDTSVYAQINPTNGPYTVNLAQMSATPPNKPWGNYAGFAPLTYATHPPSTNVWFFGAQGEVQMPLNFVQSGTYNVSVVAKSIQFQGVGPIMNVFLGPANGSVSVSSLTNTTFSFLLPVTAGVRNLVITYNNSAPGGARNLIVSQIQITPQ